MDYLIYKKLGFTRLSEEQFKKVITDSELLISSLTRDFYNFHSITDDLNSNDDFFVYRATQYQTAIAIQCDFADESGATNLLQQQTAGLTDVTIGRTHLSRTGNLFNSLTYGKSGVVKTAYDILGNTGLLYRGVSSR
ncbi:hypothetical protein [Companilactobacillus mishanensis]|uniref:Uncharacterized protein n=1 Tax=Companilactobacillus mishanensis TaxID=2486008 RepID=A0A5P0ZF84_9LACO|nr:hypothetical protein [Companilactobacillus mishanensis]MQS44247.1 hypothetical protein [Companilactobacillus mishanensis]MQS51649.1 hypothetical protein [Companilactobacillus mishanensis]